MTTKVHAGSKALQLCFNSQMLLNLHRCAMSTTVDDGIPQNKQTVFYSLSDTTFRNLNDYKYSSVTYTFPMAILILSSVKVDSGSTQWY